MANHNVKDHIFNILQKNVFSSLNKTQKDFNVSVLWHILSIKSRFSFLQLGRFSPSCEHTHRIHFEQDLVKYDWLSTKSEKGIPFSKANYKTFYNNALILDQFICRFGINPNSAKKKKWSMNYWNWADLPLKINNVLCYVK